MDENRHEYKKMAWKDMKIRKWRTLIKTKNLVDFLCNSSTPTIFDLVVHVEKKYKDTVQSVTAGNGVWFSSSAGTCNCKRSTFCGENLGHNISGNLWLITNTKLRILLSKGAS